MAGRWWVVAVALFATHKLLSQCIYLHLGQAKKVRKMIDEEEGDHDVERRGDSSESDDSEAEFSDDMF